MYSEVSLNIVNESGPFLTTLLFSVQDRVGVLDECLSSIRNLNVSLTRIERYFIMPLFFTYVYICMNELRYILFCSRPSKTPGWDYDFFVDFSAETAEQLTRVVETLEGITKQVKVVSASPVATVGVFK